MPHEVDAMLAEHSQGWLLRQMVDLDTDPEKWWRAGPLTFAGAEVAAEWVPPEGWESLPFDGEV